MKLGVYSVHPDGSQTYIGETETGNPVRIRCPACNRYFVKREDHYQCPKCHAHLIFEGFFI